MGWLQVEWVLLVRFELMLLTPINLMSIDWSGDVVNFAFRDSWGWWASQHIVCDLWYFIPRARLGGMSRWDSNLDVATCV